MGIESWEYFVVCDGCEGRSDYTFLMARDAPDCRNVTMLGEALFDSPEDVRAVAFLAGWSYTHHGDWPGPKCPPRCMRAPVMDWVWELCLAEEPDAEGLPQVADDPLLREADQRISNLFEELYA